VRVLFWRAHAHQRFVWAQTAHICAAIVNAAPKGKGQRRVYRPDDFSPYRLGEADEKIDFKDMLKLFSGKKIPRGV
jgi:hypothetical protein